MKKDTFYIAECLFYSLDCEKLTRDDGGTIGTEVLLFSKTNTLWWCTLTLPLILDQDLEMSKT